MAKPQFTATQLQWHIDNGYVTKRKHPEYDLYVLNYTEKTTFERRWNLVTQSCRGLIVDADLNIVSRPFGKFFTLNEWLSFGEEVPDEDFEVYDKLDGSLGISYSCPDGSMRISTRGSFESPQAIRGTDLFRQEFCCKVLDPSITYLFEVICEESTYVVDYNGWEGLVLIGAIDTDSGCELALDDPRFEGWIKAANLHALETPFLKDPLSGVQYFVNKRPNSEGVVVRFKSGLRLKIKSDEYMAAFKLLVNLSKKSVWEGIKNGATISDLKQNLPDHARQQVDQWATELNSEYELIYDSCLKVLEFWNREDRWPHERKEFAEWIKGQPYAAVMFAMYDKDWKKADEIVLRLIKP